MNEIFRNKTVVLAGDIGGTKTRLGLFCEGKDRPEPLVAHTYASGEATEIEDILADFIGRHRPVVKRACFGIAGPVRNGVCKTTNLSWEVSEKRIQQQFGWKRVRLINDLAATALAVPLLADEELFDLNPQSVKQRATLGILAPGTGLGQAILVLDQNEWVAVSSEGGHADFAPTNDAQIDLWRYLRIRYGHVSLERALSGAGLVNIYSWLKDSWQIPEPAWLVKSLWEDDPAKVISCTALEGRHELCVRALDTFVAIFGSAAANLALTAAAAGGIYLGGGIAPQILPALRQGLFMEAFTDKGRFKKYLEEIPVFVILNDQAAMLGAAHFALKDDGDLPHLS